MLAFDPPAPPLVSPGAFVATDNALGGLAEETTMDLLSAHLLRQRDRSTWTVKSNPDATLSRQGTTDQPVVIGGDSKCCCDASMDHALRTIDILRSKLVSPPSAALPTSPPCMQVFERVACVSAAVQRCCHNAHVSFTIVTTRLFRNQASKNTRIEQEVQRRLDRINGCSSCHRGWDK